MKDITHYFQSPSKGDEDAEAEIFVSIDSSPASTKIGNASAIKDAVSRSCAHVIVNCNRSEDNGLKTKQRKRKAKNVILDVETVANKLESAETFIISSSEMQATSQHCTRKVVTSTVAKNSMKTICKANLKHQSRLSNCKLGNAVNSLPVKKKTKSPSPISDNLKQFGPDAFEVLMSVHVQNVDDECVIVENNDKGANVCTPDEGATNYALKRENKKKRKHNLEEMARRNRKRKSRSIDGPEKQKCKKYKRVVFDDSESEDFHNECARPAIKKSDGSKEGVRCKAVSKNNAMRKNTKDEKVKLRVKNKPPDRSLGNVFEGECVVLDPDKKTGLSNRGLDENNILMLQYEKTLKHVRKAEKALRKFEKLKSRQGKTGSLPKVSEMDHEKLSAVKINVKCVDRRSDGGNGVEKPFSGKVSSKTVPPSGTESKEQHVLSKIVVQGKEAVSQLLDDSPEVFENCVETKKKSIFSYFSKISKEEVLTKSQKLSVEVLIHSPPSTPMKKKMRKIRSAQTSGQRRKLKNSQNPKEVPDKIDVLSSEVVEILDGSLLGGDVRLVGRAGDGDVRNPSRSWKVQMISDTAGAAGYGTGSESEQDQVSVDELDGSNSVFTPSKMKKDVKGVRRGRRENVSAQLQLDKKVAHTTRASRRLAVKNSVSIDKCLSPVKEVTVVPVDHKQKDESSAVASLKAVKLAPLFLQEKTRRKSKLDPAVIEARKSFLMSGVPDVVQKMINIQKSFEERICDTFPEVSHVQQIDDSNYIWKLPYDNSLVLKPEPAVDSNPAESSRLLTLGTFTNVEPAQPGTEKQALPTPPSITAFRRILREIKQALPDFPVYRMFRALRSKFLKSGSGVQGSASVPKQSARKAQRKARNAKSSKHDLACATPSLSQAHATWADKYRPMCVDDMFSNLASVRQLKTWLESWKKYVDEMNAVETVTNADESGEDSFIGDDDNSGSEHGAMPINTAILVGPVGCGKTAAVYAVATELDCKVLEINASSKRTGKRVLSEFLEATQSHQVRKSSDQNTINIKGFFREAPREKNSKKHSKMEETDQAEDHNSKKMSIILVEDADLVFEDQDDGFSSALSLLLTSSKRPVILTSSDPSCPHLSKLMQQYTVLQFAPPPARLISVWLQLVSLLEGSRLSYTALQRLFDASSCDMRKTINTLQFWVHASGSCVDSEERLRALAPVGGPQLLETGVCVDDDSNLVWTSSRSGDEREASPAPVCDAPLSHCCSGILPCPPMGALWWNVGLLLGVCTHQSSCRPPPGCVFEHNNFFPECCTTEDEEINDWKCNPEVKKDKCRCNVDCEILQPIDDECTVECSSIDTQSCRRASDPTHSSQGRSACLQVQMDSVSRLMDTLSETCIMYTSSLQCNDAVDLEPSMRPWEQMVKDGISLKDDFHTCNFTEKTTSEGLCSYLVQESIEQCSISLAQVNNRERERCRNVDWTDAFTPSAENVRWRAQKHKADKATSSAISLSSQLDHCAVSLDYNPLLRAIGRLEKSRLAINSKRKNRFFHYLKGLGVDTTESVLNTMCSTFEES